MRRRPLGSDAFGRPIGNYERLFRDVRATEIYQGTSQAQQMIIAANILANV